MSALRTGTPWRASLQGIRVRRPSRQAPMPRPCRRPWSARSPTPWPAGARRAAVALRHPPREAAGGPSPPGAHDGAGRTGRDNLQWRPACVVTTQYSEERVGASTVCRRYATPADEAPPSMPVVICRSDPPDVAAGCRLSAASTTLRLADARHIAIPSPGRSAPLRANRGVRRASQHPRRRHPGRPTSR